MATLRAVENVWRIEKQNLNAEQIAKKAGDLYDKFVGFINDLESVGKAIEKADNSTKKRSTNSTLGTGTYSIVQRRSKNSG